MKPTLVPNHIPDLAGILAALILSTGAAHAAPFHYSPGDLVLTFRLSGNASDLVVNVGSITNYNARPAGDSVAVSQLDPAQLTAAFPSLNGLAWSVSGANRPPGVPGVPVQTLWVTAPRLDPAVQSPAWLRKGQFVQGNAASRIDVVGLNAAAFSSSQPAGPNNTAAGVVLPSSGDYAASPILGTEGDLGGYFQGSIESTTSDSFDTAPDAVSRTDLYELLPGTSAAGTLDQPGRYLGYFELKPSGSLSFSTIQSLPPRPAITGITRQGDVARISFTTVAGAKYQLSRTTAAGLTTPGSAWTPGPSATGNGSVLTLEDPSPGDAQFYRIEVQP